MKKIISLVLAISLMVSLVGCNGGSSTQGSTESNSGTDSQSTQEEQKTPESDVKEITFYSAILVEDACNEAVKGFQEETGIKVKVRSFDSADFVQAFMVAANGGSPIDVLLLNGQDVREFVKKGLVQDLSNLSYKDRLLDTAIDQYTLNDKLYALGAKGGNSSGIFVNLDLYEKYGVKLPATMDDLRAANKTFKENGLSLFAFGGGNKYMWPMWYFSIFAQTSGNKPAERTEEILTGNAKFTDADSIEAFQVIETLAKEDMFQPGFNGTDSDGGKAVFVGEKAATFFGGTWEIPGFREAGMKNIDLLPFPIIKEGATSQQTGNASDGAYCIYSKIDPANQAVAEQFIEYMTRDEVIEGFRASSMPKLAEYAALSANKNIKSPADVDPLIEKTQKEFYPMTFTHFDWVYPPEITTALQDTLQALTGLQITPEQAGQQMQDAMDKLLSSGYDFNAVK